MNVDIHIIKENEEIRMIRDIFQLPSIRQIALGNLHIIFLLNTGYVYGKGNNKYGQLTLSNEYYQDITIININISIKYIYASSNESYFLSNNHSLYGCGKNDLYQLGITGINIKELILIIDNVSIFAAGYSHCIAYLNNHKLYSWGWNLYGQCGCGYINEYIDKPKKISLNSFVKEKIANIKLSRWRSLILTDEGFLYVAGRRPDINMIEIKPNIIYDDHIIRDVINVQNKADEFILQDWVLPNINNIFTSDWVDCCFNKEEVLAWNEKFYNKIKLKKPKNVFVLLKDTKEIYESI